MALKARVAAICGSQVALHLAHGTEIERTAHIHHQHHGKLSLFFKDLDERAMEASVTFQSMSLTSSPY